MSDRRGGRHPPDPLAAEVVEPVVEEVAESMAGATDPTLRHKLAELAAPLLSPGLASPVTAPWPGLATGDCDAPRPPRPERGLER